MNFDARFFNPLSCIREIRNERKIRNLKLSLNDVYDDFNQIFSISAIIDAGY